MTYVREASPIVADYFERMRVAVENSGPIPEKFRELCLLAGAVGARNEQQVRLCIRRAAAKGVSAEEMRHAILLLLGLVQGLSPLVDTLGWLEQELSEQERG